MNCKEATRAISDGQDQALGWRVRMRLRFHLMICPYCLDFSRQTRFLRQAARLAKARQEHDER